MLMAALRILDPARTQATLRRMAFELAERCYGQPRVSLRGVSIRGEALALRLATELKGVGGIEVTVLSQTDPVPTGLPLVLVDDVLYSGRTLLSTLAALAPLAAELPQILVAVLIDRGHRRYPVSADVVGVQLATTLQQYVRVEVSEGSPTIDTWLE